LNELYPKTQFERAYLIKRVRLIETNSLPSRTGNANRPSLQSAINATAAP
jgi:hypothetical protein